MTDVEVTHPDEPEAVPASQEKIDPRDQNYYLESITFKVGPLAVYKPETILTEYLGRRTHL
jgi:hypothetical protein